MRGKTVNRYILPDGFVTAAKKNSCSIEKQIISFISKQNSRAEHGEITTAPVGNCLCVCQITFRDQ
ncbi:MAG: hypothetical protein ACJ72V_00525 [Nitrososphaeraceae archaeon]